MPEDTRSNDHNLRVEMDPGRYRLSAGEWAKMESDLDNLGRVVADFPIRELKIELTAHRGSVRVGTALRLPGQTLYAADERDILHPAWERCLAALVEQVGRYKEKMSNKPTYTKQQEGTVQRIEPSLAPDPKAVRQAVDNMDYPTFRQLMWVYEEGVRRRVGRWIQRYPEAEDMLGTVFTLNDVVENVFLNAFEQYAGRPAVPVGAWLEVLIDQAIKAMSANPDEERQNARFAETAMEADLANLPPVPPPTDLPPPPETRV